MSRVHGPWNLADLKSGLIGAPKNGLKVFSCFHCGGGSTMGYKLAGFTVLGGVEIDPEMMRIYRKNHGPAEKFSFLMGVQDFNKIPDAELPPELFDLDILDGSPPCSSFSMSGNRDDDWGKKKKFREGQAEQVLDELFFHFIDTAKKLKPKVVIAENVKGLILGKAKKYAREVLKRFDEAGYGCQLYLLNASRMGVPQRRERTIFVARRRDMEMPPINLRFDEPLQASGDWMKGVSSEGAKPLYPGSADYWDITPPGMRFRDFHPKGFLWDMWKLDPAMPAHTLIASKLPMHWAEKRHISPAEVVRLQSFPDDYDFDGLEAGYVCGMSVPPLMMQRIALEVARQLFGVDSEG